MTSSTNAKKMVESHFELAKNQVIAALENRMTFLLTTISEIETKDLEPLKNLRQQMEGDLSRTKTLIHEGIDCELNLMVTQMFLIFTSSFC